MRIIIGNILMIVLFTILMKAAYNTEMYITVGICIAAIAYFTYSLVSFYGKRD